MAPMCPVGLAVALSRCRSPSGIQVLGWDPSKIHASVKVQQYYNTFAQQLADAQGQSPLLLLEQQHTWKLGRHQQSILLKHKAATWQNGSCCNALAALHMQQQVPTALASAATSILHSLKLSFCQPCSHSAAGCCLDRTSLMHSVHSHA